MNLAGINDEQVPRLHSLFLPIDDAFKSMIER
jgi:hypothetical protein